MSRCPTCDSALRDPKSGWSVAAPECSDPWHDHSVTLSHRDQRAIVDALVSEYERRNR